MEKFTHQLTTTALIHHILHEAGRPAQMAGNIGRGVLDIDPARDGEVIVLELSSYQTELARALTPDVAVFTNLSPDHLDRHGGMGGYFAAKRRLFAEGGPDRAVVGVDEVEGRYLANQLSEGKDDDRVIRISSGQKLEACGWTLGGWMLARLARAVPGAGFEWDPRAGPTVPQSAAGLAAAAAGGLRLKHASSIMMFGP
jgi:UDP-N-acetylmuramoylalanine-D-glutamate ligase